MTEVFVLTHEYSDRSSFTICGVTESRLVAHTWINGSYDTHAYKVPIDQIMKAHPGSDGWPRWKP